MNSSPLVSVIIPCFNSEKYLSAAIESVLNQTYRELELIIVDDCSTDGTIAIINQYQATDKRIRLIKRGERGGRPAITKNTGIEHIRGTFVCFLDHDDYYLPDKIQTLLIPLLEHPACVASFHDVDLVDPDNKFISQYLDKFTIDAKEYLTKVGSDTYISRNNFFSFQSIHYAAIHTISVMIAIERLDKKNLYFDTIYKVCDDTDLWIRLGLAGPIAYVNKRLSHYRQHASNITRNQLKVQEDIVLLLVNNFPRIAGKITTSEKNKLTTRISNSYNDLGWLYRLAHSPAKSVSAYIKAWKWSGETKHLIHAAKALLPARAPRQ